MSLFSTDIKDSEVRKWFLSRTKNRNWMFPLYAGNHKNTKYLDWMLKNVVGDGSLVVLVLDEFVLEAANKVFSQFPIVKFFDKKFNPEQFEKILNKHNIDSFFSHASFAPPMCEIRLHLLTSPRFEKTLSVWHEGGFLRRKSGNYCFQLDWLGWNAWSSLACVDWHAEKDLSPQESDFVKSYMNEFYECKTSGEKMSSEYLRDKFKTQKRIVVVPLQVQTDSVIQNFVPSSFRQQDILFDFAESRSDCFFVFKEHPKQTKSLERAEGKNFSYIPDADCDTLALCAGSDLVLVLNSTVGFESLYWTPVVTIGRSAYSNDFVSYRFREFSSALPPKPQKNIEKFLHYAIKYFHYSPGVNASNHQEWFNFIDEYRLKFKHLISRQTRQLLSYPSPSFR